MNNKRSRSAMLLPHACNKSRRANRPRPLRLRNLTPVGELFQRHANNPLLTAASWPYAAHAVFNPGATQLPSGETLLLVRVEDYRGISHLTAARSRDGVRDWHIDAQPTFSASPEQHPEELWGVEDPRIVPLAGLGGFAVTYTAYSRAGDYGRLQDVSTPRLDHGPRRQGRRAVPAPVWRSVGPDSSARTQHPGGQGQHVAIVLARPAQLGRPQRLTGGAGWCLVGRGQDRAVPAAHCYGRGLAHRLSRRTPHAV